MADSAPKPTAAKPPKPKKATPPASATAEAPKRKSDKPRGRPPELQKQLEEMLMMVGLMTAGAVNQFDGEIIRDNAASLAEGWYKVSQSNATVKRILTAMMETGSWSGAIGATAAVAIPILQNHGAIPAGIPHPFKKPPHLEPQQAQQPQPTMAHVPPHGGQPMPTPPHGAVVPPQQGSPITPSQATHSPPQPPPQPPGSHSG